MKLNFIGCGKLGRSIAKLLISHTDCELTGVMNQSLESGQSAVDFIGTGTAFESTTNLHGASTSSASLCSLESDNDIICIGTGDEQIEAICQTLSFEPGQIVIHFSGALPSSILQSAKDQGALIASVHPIKSFADPELAVNSFDETPVSFEGDKKALTVLIPLFEQCGAKCSIIDSSHKMRYHAACVMATNYLVTLNHISRTVFEAAGMDYDHAASTTSKIMADTLTNINNIVDSKKALTGPIARGEKDIIQQHIETLTELNLADAYKALATETLNLTDHNDETFQNLKAILSLGNL